MKEKRSEFKIKISALQRYLMWHYLQKPLDLILVSEFPKSGGSWYSQMLSYVLEVPFPRNKAPKFERAIMHGHLLNSRNFDRVISVMRDGRDIMVSAYFHFLFENDRNPSFSVKKWREKVPFNDFENIEKNLPEFINYMFTQYTSAGKKVSWSDFVRSYLNQSNSLIVKYEDLLINPQEELIKSVQFLDVRNYNLERIEQAINEFSFQNLTKRLPGKEDSQSFIRKGIAGDWKNHFNQESREVFKKYAGQELILAGYETTIDW